MRVLLVTHRYPPFGLTGVERLCQQTATALRAAGHDVTVLMRRETFAPPIPKLEESKRDGIRLVMVSGGGPAHERFPKLGPWLDRCFERTLLDVDPDVVLISHLMNHSPAYVAIARRWGVPVVMELHDFYMACERAHLERTSGEHCQGPEGGRACATYCFAEQRRPLERWALRTHAFRRALEQADALIAPSRFVADYFSTSFGVGTAARLHVLGNGIGFDPAASRPATGSEVEPLRLACIGVVAHHKGTHIVLEALRRAQLGSVRLTLFGAITQPYFGEMLAQADALEGLRLYGYGPFAPAELPMLLGDVDAVLVPSLVWESYSIAAREALACGIPVIASRIGALPEAVHDGENGLLFEPGSANQLARILHDIDADRSRLGELRRGIRAGDWISVEDRTRALEGLLEDVVAHHRPAVGTATDLDELLVLRDELLERAPI